MATTVTVRVRTMSMVEAAFTSGVTLWRTIE